MTPRTRKRRPAAAAVLLTMFLVVAAGVVLSAGGAHESPANQAAQTPSTQPSAGGAPAVARSVPARMTIPRLDLRTKLLRLEASRDGMMQLPRVSRAGWYTGSVTPGETGITVVAGYIRRTTSEPGVFVKLGRLRQGDEVSFRRLDGTTATYAVTRIESYPKGAFPAAKVYAVSGRPELRIVTTGGALRGGDPLGNVVVYAQLTD